MLPETPDLAAPKLSPETRVDASVTEGGMPRPADGRSQRRGARLFVWTTWCLSVALAVSHALQGKRYPYTDDWYLLPVLTRTEPVTLSWIWSLFGQHRIPLPRVIFLLLYNRVIGYDFRAGGVFSALAFGVLTLAMILVAKRLRGWTRYTDAFFPLSMLHWGLAAFGWTFAVQFVSSTIVASSVLLLIIRNGGFSTLGEAFLGGSLVLLLPATGLSGVAMAPCLALFLGYTAFNQWRHKARASKWTPVVLLSFATACFCLCAFLALESRGRNPEYASTGIVSTLKAAVIFSAAGLGPAFAAYASAPGWGNLWRLAVPALLMVTAVLLFKRLFTNRSDVHRVVGLLLFLGALGALGLAIGFGRGGRVWDEDLDAHYGTLALPILCFVYFAWEIYGSPRAKRVVEASLFTVVSAAFLLNGPLRVGWSNGNAAQDRSVERDVLAGMSRCEVVERHLRWFWWWDETTSWGRTEGAQAGREHVGKGLVMLGRAGVAPFRSFGNDPLSGC